MWILKWGFTVIEEDAWWINIYFSIKLQHFTGGGYGVTSTNSRGDGRYRPSPAGISYKSLKFRLYNTLYKKHPRYVPVISYTREDLGELAEVINMEIRYQSEGGGKRGWENNMIQGSHIMCIISQEKILVYLEYLIRLELHHHY